MPGWNPLPSDESRHGLYILKLVLIASTNSRLDNADSASCLQEGETKPPPLNVTLYQ